MKAYDAIYQDVLAKYNGDHAQTQRALQNLGIENESPKSSAQATTLNYDRQRSERIYPRRPEITATSTPPLPGFRCPLTGIIMRDPVLLEDTRITYERAAIEYLLRIEPDRCPVSGRVLTNRSLVPDEDLRASIRAWAKSNNPELVDTSGQLLPYSFSRGVDTAIQAHRGASRALSDTSNTPLPAIAYRPNAVHTSGRVVSSGNTTSDLAIARQLQADSSHAPLFISSPAGAEAVLHDILIERARANQQSYGYVTPAIHAVMFAGFLVPLAINSWALTDVSRNPWVGVPQESLLQAGASCTTCIVDGEWWRVLSSLAINAGVAQALLVAFSVTFASAVTSQTGMSLWGFAASVSAGGLLGSLTSAAAADETVHSTSTALAAAALASATVAIVSVRRFVLRWGWTVALLVGWLALLLVASFSPFADTWATLAGAFVGGLSSAAVMAPVMVKRRGRLDERLVILWQVGLAVFVVGVGAAVVVALLAMPKTGFDCDICEKVSCADFLGWKCVESLNREGYCELSIFPDATAKLTCPSNAVVDLEASDVDAQDGSVDALCAERCTDVESAR